MSLIDRQSWPFRKILLTLPVAMLSALLLLGCASNPMADSSGKFEIGLIGDQHYDARSAAQFPNIMAEMNRADLAFVVHVGDNGTPGYDSCKFETHYKRRDEFNQSRHPFVFTPGDNDWTDCHEAGMPGAMESLAKVREVFFQGDSSLGKRTMPVTRQSSIQRYASYRENARWTLGGVVFVTLHMPGSNNNLGRTADMDAEYAARNIANLEWMRQAFEYAKKNNSKGLMLLTQANPKFEDALPDRRKNALSIRPPSKKLSGYADFLQAFQKEVLAYEKPIVLVHGDTHYFRIDKPLVINDNSGARRGSIVENFTRVEVFGYPEAHWVRAIIDPSDPNIFSFRAQMVKENIEVRRTR
jgi:predicted phosphodiesterase